jgi:hypothetical protein
VLGPLGDQSLDQSLDTHATHGGPPRNGPRDLHPLPGPFLATGDRLRATLGER